VVPGPARAGVHRRPADVKLRAQEGTLPSGTLELIAHATSKLSCADPDGATLNLYTPLFKWVAEDEEDYSASILRRMRDILNRTRDNPTTAYVGALWAWAHARAYRLSLNEQCGVDRIYADGVAPEQCRTYDLSCADTAFVWEKVPLRPVAPSNSRGSLLIVPQELVDIFNPASSVTTAAGRLIGKGLRPLASASAPLSLTPALQSNMVVGPVRQGSDHTTPASKR
jgi:hypothetical protein